MSGAGVPTNVGTPSAPTTHWVPTSFARSAARARGGSAKSTRAARKNVRIVEVLVFVGCAEGDEVLIEAEARLTRADALILVFEGQIHVAPDIVVDSCRGQPAVVGRVCVDVIDVLVGEPPRNRPEVRNLVAGGEPER